MSSERAARIAGERKAIRALCEAAIQQGFALSYFDEEECVIKKTKNLSDIMAETHVTNEAAIIILNEDERVGVFHLIYENAPDELIVDYGWVTEADEQIMAALYAKAVANSGAAMAL